MAIHGWEKLFNCSFPFSVQKWKKKKTSSANGQKQWNEPPKLHFLDVLNSLFSLLNAKATRLTTHQDTHIVRPPPLPLPPITSSPSAPSQLLPFLEPNSHHEDDPCTVKWSSIKCSPFPAPHSHHDDDPCEMVFFLRCLSSALHSLINCGHDYTIFVPCTVKGSQSAERIGQERSLLYFCCTDTS